VPVIADSIAVLERGSLRAFGSFDALTRAGLDFSKIIPPDDTTDVTTTRKPSDPNKDKEKKESKNGGTNGNGGGRGRGGAATAAAEAFAAEILAKYPPPHRGIQLH
jgi:hypothetical protein